MSFLAGYIAMAAAGAVPRPSYRGIAPCLACLIRRRGCPLEAAPRASLDDFDGLFSSLAAAENQVGAARGRLGIRPIRFFHQNGLLLDGLLLGTEQASLEALDPDNFATRVAPGEVKLWSKN